MAQFYYWRWFKETSGGPMGDLGSHQVDIFNWYLNAVPHTITAMGDNTWAKQSAKREPKAGFEPNQLDHTLVQYHYETENGPVNGLYSVRLNTSKGGFYEDFYGDAGTVTTAEIVDKAGMHKEQEAEALAWEDKVETAETGDGDQKYVLNPARSLKAGSSSNSEKVKEVEQKMKIAKKAPHLPHERNFVEAIRGNEKLNCDAEVGYETAVTSLKAHEAALTGKTMKLKESDFKV
jgi:predicted dehydrogenase